MVTQNKKKENTPPASTSHLTDDQCRRNSKREPISKSRPDDSTSFFDLRSTQGQILFLFITIAVSSLVQMLPNDTLRNIIFNQTFSAPHPQLLSCESALSNTALKVTDKRLTYWTYGKSNVDDQLKHVNLVLNRLGFEKVTNESTDWDLLWAHDYPFRVMYPKLHNLQYHQRVNHFPGCGFITNKVDLATADLPFIPKAFKLPDHREKFIEYATANPDKLFVQKHNQHRHIYIKNITDINFADNDTFLQEFVDNPLLVDGHKFDIGVYVIITSMDPLRVYIYKGDILFRYCPAKYYPFDANNVDKYIVGDDYLPTWEVPSLSPLYNGLKFGMKDSFDAYMKNQGRDPSIIWLQVEEAIREAILSQERNIVNVLKKFKFKHNFFEMMRFDLVIDNNLKVYLMEANMSPNLSSAHFLPNTLLYEQVIFNLLNLVGVGSTLHRESLRKSTNDFEAMQSSDKNIAVYADVCSKEPCTVSCAAVECKLCRPCLAPSDLAELHAAYREHVNRGDTKRIFPKPVLNKQLPDEATWSAMSVKNQMMTKWFLGKCEMDSSWCS